MRTPRHWSPGHVILPTLLGPLSWLYGLADKARRATANPARAPVPVICLGNITAGGSIDTRYQITMNGNVAQSPAGTLYVLQPEGGSNYPISAWFANSPSSQWISTYSAPVIQGTTVSPAGDQSYRFSFDLRGYDPSTARVQGRWAVDNYGTDILINGVSTGQSTDNTIPDNPNNPGFRAFTDFEITTGFEQGENTVDFETLNREDVVGEGSISGIRVEGTVTASTLGRRPRA